MTSKLREMAFVGAIVAAVIGVAAAGAEGSYGNETINYTYDNSGELVSVARTGTVSGNTVNTVTNYTYDHAENRLTMNTH